MLGALDQLIEDHGDGAEDDDGGDHHVKLEYLRSVDDQIAKSPSGGQKLADDDAHQSQTDVDFHAAQDKRNGAWQDHLKESVPAAAAQRVDQFAHFRIHLTEASVQADDGSKDRNGDPGSDDSVRSSAQPDDEQGCQSGFGKCVQDDQVRFQDIGETFLIPEECGGEET